MKAKDVMIPVKDFLSPGDTLKTAVNLLRRARRGEGRIGTKGLPVLDEHGRLVGMLSMHDALKAAVPFYMGISRLGGFSWDGMVEEVAKKSGSKRVGDIMSTNVITVDEDAPLMECVDLMVNHNIKRLPVVDKAGRVIGMIYERDIFFAVTKGMLEEEER